MDFWDGTGWDGFFEGRWNGKAIPIMNELVQVARGLSLHAFYLHHPFNPRSDFGWQVGACLYGFPSPVSRLPP